MSSQKANAFTSLQDKTFKNAIATKHLKLF